MEVTHLHSVGAAPVMTAWSFSWAELKGSQKCIIHRGEGKSMKGEKEHCTNGRMKSQKISNGKYSCLKLLQGFVYLTYLQMQVLPFWSTKNPTHLDNLLFTLLQYYSFQQQILLYPKHKDTVLTLKKKMSPKQSINIEVISHRCNSNDEE